MTVGINMTDREIDGATKPTGQAHLRLLITDQDIEMHIPPDFTWLRMMDAYWHTLPYCKSLKFVSLEGMKFAIDGLDSGKTVMRMEAQL